VPINTYITFTVSSQQRLLKSRNTTALEQGIYRQLLFLSPWATGQGK